MRISLKQLIVFDAVAKFGSVSKAANDISLSQSAASMSLSELEATLVPRFFTVEANVYNLMIMVVGYNRRLTQLLIQAHEIELSSQGNLVQGSLKLGASTTIGNYMLPSAIAAFVTQHPHINIQLEVANTEQIVSGMQNLKYDIGFIEGPSHAPLLNIEIWNSDELIIFSSPDHPLAKKQNIQMEELKDAQWILREVGSGTREVFSIASQEKLINPNVTLELGNSEAVKLAVKTGLGLGCLSKLAIQAELDAGSLVQLRNDFFDLKRNFFLIQGKDNYQSQVLKKFLASL